MVENQVYPLTFITDRTSIETDWTCGQKRWWMLHEGGRGIVPVNTPAPLRDGIAIHASLAALLENNELILPPPPTDGDQEEMEAWAREVGWLVAFHTYAWPKWFAPFYDVVAIEQEQVLDRPGIWIAFTADIVLRNKTTGKLLVVDFKSVGNLSREWVESWGFAPQMHLNGIGVEEELKQPVSAVQVIGLQKGQWRDGKIRHPYVWAYSDGERWSTDWKKGWGLRPLWEYGSGGVEGVREWVLLQGEGVGLSQFPLAVPVVPSRRVVERLVQDRLKREDEVNQFFQDAPNMDPEVRQAEFRKVFESRFKNCRPSYGPGCDYLSACWNADVNADPIGSGLFKERIPHHNVEVG